MTKSRRVGWRALGGDAKCIQNVVGESERRRLLRKLGHIDGRVILKLILNE
jgi:hypothetical protein